MRTILVLAGLLAATAAPVTAAAQHGATPAPAAHAATTAKPAAPAAKSEAATTHAATPAKPAEKAVEKTAATHDAKPASSAKASAATAEKPGKPGENSLEKATEKASDKAAAARKGAPFSDLEAAFDRIAQKIQGAEVMPGGLRISSGSPVAPERAAESRPAEPRAARADATPRIHLNWRAALVWPAPLGQGDTHDAATPHDTTRITLAWE